MPSWYMQSIFGWLEQLVGSDLAWSIIMDQKPLIQLLSDIGTPIPEVVSDLMLMWEVREQVKLEEQS